MRARHLERVLVAKKIRYQGLVTAAASRLRERAAGHGRNEHRPRFRH
jgi:hypothetical protein